MSDIIDVNISEEPVPEVVEVHVDENAAQTAIDAAALAQNALTQVQNLVANIADVNTILNDEGFVKDATTFTGNENSVWNINGVEYTNPADVIINIPLAATGMQRWDRIVLNTSNLFERVPGPELETNPPVPSLPDDTLDYTLFLVTDSTVGDPSPPIVGDIYKKKIENIRWKSNQSGSDVVIDFRPEGYFNYSVINSGLISVAGFSTDLLTTSIAEGQDILFENQTGNAIGLKNMFAGISTPFNLGADLVVPNDGKIWFRYRNGKLELIMKSWSEGIKGFHRFQSPNFSPAANTTYYIGGLNIGLLGSAQTSNLHARVKAMVTGKIGKVSFFASAGLSTGVGANVYLDNITKGTSLTIASNFIWTTNGAVNFISNSDFLVDIGDFLTIRLKIGGDGTGGGGGTNNNFWAELTIE